MNLPSPPFTAVPEIPKKVQMALKLIQLQGKVAQASSFMTKHGCVYYKQLLEKNNQYIVDLPTVEMCQEMSKKLFYTRLTNIPLRYQESWKELDSVKHIWRNKQELEVEDVGITDLFGFELYAWFYVGEIVGLMLVVESEQAESRDKDNVNEDNNVVLLLLELNEDHDGLSQFTAASGASCCTM